MIEICNSFFFNDRNVIKNTIKNKQTNVSCAYVKKKREAPLSLRLKRTKQP